MIYSQYIYTVNVWCKTSVETEIRIKKNLGRITKMLMNIQI